MSSYPKAGYGRLIVSECEVTNPTDSNIVVSGGRDGYARGVIIDVGAPDERYAGLPCDLTVGDVAVFKKDVPDGKGGKKPMAVHYYAAGKVFYIVLQVEVVALEDPATVVEDAE